MHALRIRIALACVAVIASMALPVSVAASTATTTTVQLESTTARLDQDINASVTVDPIPPYPTHTLGGTVRLKEILANNSRVFIKVVGVIEHGVGTFPFTLPRAFGTKTYVVEYDGYSPAGFDPSESQPFTVTFTKGQSYMEITPSATTLEQHTPLVIDVGLASGNDLSGTVTLYRGGSATPLCSMARSTEPLRCTINSTLPVGALQFYGVYDGSAEWLGTQSENVGVTVTTDLFHGTINAPAYATFYPVTDGYRDAEKFTGTRDEMISGTIQIYSPTGTLARTLTLTAGDGPYTLLWDGRLSTGTIRPEGKYKVVTTLKDAGNVTKTATHYVTLSKKKLLWHAGTITKKGSSFSASGKHGSASVTYNTTSGYVRLKSTNGYAGDWAGAGWEFTLTGGVVYRSLVVRVYAKHNQVFHSARLGSQNFSTCSYVANANWGESCFDGWKELAGANGSIVWTSTSTLSASHLSGTKARSLLSVRSADVYVYKARASFQYATLGY